MKIRLRHGFRYQIDATTVGELPRGVHDVDDELARKAIRFGGAKIVEKKAPENKLGKVPENKSKVVKKRRRRAGSKSKP